MKGILLAYISPASLIFHYVYISGDKHEDEENLPKPEGFFIPLIFSANAFALPVTWSTNGHMHDVIPLSADWNTARTSA